MRLRSLVAILCLSPLAPLFSGAAPAQVRGETSFAKLQDVARPLLIFAPNADDRQLLAQLKVIEKHAAEMKERNVVAIALPGHGLAPTPAKLTSVDAEAARRRFHVKRTDFTVVLIGKDGGEKLRSSQPFSIETLRSLIDAMPMRRDEMRSRPQ